jgi:multidrug efflux pump subunit AcrA (membrane-fusion protein)
MRGLVAALALAVSALSGCKPAPADQPADPVVTVKVATVEVRTFSDLVDAPGRWKNAGELPVKAPAAGVVESLTPRPGDRVSAGEVVGRLMTRESRAALEGAQLLFNQARSAAAQADARRALELAQRDVVHVRVIALQSGVVLRRSAEPGTDVDQGAELLALAPPGGIVFEAHVPPTNAQRVHVGERATITVAPESPRPATVRSVLPQADSTDQSTLVWLSPSTASPPPAIDRFGSAAIEVGAPRVSPAVPEAALVEDDLTGETRVAVVTAAGRAQWTTLTVGVTKDGWREVITPRLARGMRVVIEGQHGLIDSTRVEIAK